MASAKYTRKRFPLVHNDTYDFYTLSVNGHCLFEEFLSELKDEAQDAKKLHKIYLSMNVLGGEARLPKSKFRHIEDAKIKNLWEFKQKDIRVYVVKESPDVYIILGGYKGNQDKDIKRLKIIAKDLNTEEL